MGGGREKDYLIDNIAMLLASGVDILSALDAIRGELHSPRLKKIVWELKEEIESGTPLWKALDRFKLFPPYVVSLIRIGEEAGQLSENLNIVVERQRKERVFYAKIRSALTYPLFVLSLAAIVGVGSVWFVLSRLSVAFKALNLELPRLTVILITFGGFLKAYGIFVVPSFIFAIVAAVYFLFIFKKTRFVGEAVLLALPGTKRLIREIELARFGHAFGTLLGAGLPITQALESLRGTAHFHSYRKLYEHLKARIEEGSSFQRSFADYPHIKKLISAPVQEMIVTGERSGHLSDALLRIGKTFEERIDVTAKNFTAILEPVLLIIVWLGVVLIAFSVIIPVYSLIGNINRSALPRRAAPTHTILEDTTSKGTTPPAEQNAPPSASKPKEEEGPLVPAGAEPLPLLEILPTELGYLNVRSGPSTENEIIDSVTPGALFEYRAEQNGWYEIMVRNGEFGWVAGRYVRIAE